MSTYKSIRKNCWEVRCTYISSGFARLISCLCCLFSTASSHSGLDTCFVQDLLSEDHEPNPARQWRTEGKWGNCEKCSKLTTSRTFPPLVQAALPTFVPTDTLEQLKNCGKNTGKSADAVAEFASFKGPLRMFSRMLSFVDDVSVCASEFRGRCYLL